MCRDATGALVFDLADVRAVSEDGVEPAGVKLGHRLAVRHPLFGQGFCERVNGMTVIGVQVVDATDFGGIVRMNLNQ